MASANDRPADTVGVRGVVGCCAAATAAGPSRRPATINTCFMVVLDKICREVEALYARVPAAVSACDRNLAWTTSPARSTAGHALRGEVSGRDFDLHEAAVVIQPEADGLLTLRTQGDGPQAGRVPVQGGRSNTQVADLQNFAPEPSWEDDRERAGLGGRAPRREYVRGKYGIVEHGSTRPRRKLSRPFSRASDQAHGEPPAAQLAEDARRLPRIGDIILQGRGHRVAVDFENRGQHDHRPRAIVPDRRGQDPAGLAA